MGMPNGAKVLKKTEDNQFGKYGMCDAPLILPESAKNSVL